MVGKQLADFGMPTSQHIGELSTDLIRELSYDIAALEAQEVKTELQLLTEQKKIFLKIVNHTECGQEGIFFLDVPGDTGKTFLLNLLLAQLRKGRNIAQAVAFSGIPATLLSRGRTAHSVFTQPLNWRVNKHSHPM